LARSLRRLRDAKGLTQEQAAEMAGVNWRHWQKLEAGEVNVTLNTLERICRGLKVDVRELFESTRS
jgi:transcriptional regulator with XRE-family HTH domain